MTGVARTLPVRDLRPHPSNVRKDLGDLSELVASVRSQGLLQPLLVAPRRVKGTGQEVYVVLDGHRRFAAARQAALAEVPCMVTLEGPASQTVATMLAAAMHKQLAPLEQAAAFEALRDQGVSTVQIAKATGYAIGTVRDRLGLLAMPEQVQQMVADKEVTLSAAKDLGRQLKKSRSGTVDAGTARSSYFDRTHRLADDARDRCTEGHKAHRVRVGGVACGQCWEQAILEAGARS